MDKIEAPWDAGMQHDEQAHLVKRRRVSMEDGANAPCPIQQPSVPGTTQAIEISPEDADEEVPGAPGDDDTDEDVRALVREVWGDDNTDDMDNVM